MRIRGSSRFFQVSISRESMEFEIQFLMVQAFLILSDNRADQAKWVDLRGDVGAEMSRTTPRLF